MDEKILKELKTITKLLEQQNELLKWIMTHTRALKTKAYKDLGITEN